jgi:hypothetical protein
MPDPRSLPDDRPNVGSEPLEDELRALAGEEPADEQDAALDLDEVETAPEPTVSDLDYGDGTSIDPELREEAAGSGDVVSLDALVDTDLREGETDNPLIAVEEGMTYVAPTDPPVGGEDEELSPEADLNARIREAIEADAATAGFADRILIATIGSTAILRGVVDDLTDGDNLVAVVEQVEGIDEVRDETEVASLG